MNCQRSEELLSDFLERNLAPLLESQLEAHLEGCGACRNLLAAVLEGVEISRALEVPEPPEDLTARILERTRPALAAARLRRAEAAATTPSSSPFGYGWVAAAAMLALVLLWRPPEPLSSFGRHASQTLHQTYSYGLRMYHRAEGWLDDLDVLRATVAVAFEDRLDRLNERLRILQKASSKADDEDGSESSNAIGGDGSRV